MRFELLESGASETTLVFLPGWACSAEDFCFQVEYFKNQYRILTIDCTDFIAGKIDVSHNLFDLCVAEITREIMRHAMRNIVLVGHSMGGVMALSLQSKLEHLVTQCVLIDSSIAMPGEAAEKYAALIEALCNVNGESVLVKTIEARMINQRIDNMNLMNAKKNQMISAWRKSPKTFAKLLADACAYNASAALANCSCPLLYIASYPGFSELTILNTFNDRINFYRLISGHFVILNQPEEVNRLMLKFLQAACG